MATDNSTVDSNTQNHNSNLYHIDDKMQQGYCLNYNIFQDIRIFIINIMVIMSSSIGVLAANVGALR